MSSNKILSVINGVMELEGTQGKSFFIDTLFYEKIKWYRWYIHHDNRNKYRVRHTLPSKKMLSLPRLILNITDSKVHVDHINGNTLDNRICNLRKCSNKENIRNRKKGKDNTTGFKGVVYREGKYLSKIKYDGKQIYGGTFNKITEAAKSYDILAFKYFGEYAKPNYIWL